MKAKKGFTIIELIVVIAIIAVLTGIILSMSNNKSEKIQAANGYARDFYSTVQYSFTKYMKYEAELSIAIKNDTASANIIAYNKNLNGNFPKNKYTYIDMYIKNNQIVYVRAMSSLKALLQETSDNCITAFDELLKNDFDTLMETSVDGHFFALVEYDDAGLTSTTGASVKVHSAYYTAQDLLTVVDGAEDDYRTDNLRFNDNNILANGNICGVCTSVKDGDIYIGTVGTYFMNVSSSLTNS